MVWFFERQGEKLECEIRQERPGEPFEVVIRNAERQNLERHQDPAELLRRSSDLWTQLLTSGWRPKLPPTWPNQRAQAMAPGSAPRQTSDPRKSARPAGN